MVNLKDVLRPLLPEEKLRYVVRAYDVIGDVAIIKIPAELEDYQHSIGQRLLDAHPALRLVARSAGMYSGEFRIMPLAFICGGGGFATLHKEYGVKLHVDPSRVYYSPRSASERFRIADCVLPGERVLVMFSGIAPLPLVVAKHSRASEIVGIEKSAIAHQYGMRNVIANRSEDNVLLVHGDVKGEVPRLDTLFDRVALPLPMVAQEYLQTALATLRCDGWLHYYDFQKTEKFAAAISAVREACVRSGREIVSVQVHRCGHIRPGKYRICVDARIA